MTPDFVIEKVNKLLEELSVFPGRKLKVPSNKKEGSVKYSFNEVIKELDENAL